MPYIVLVFAFSYSTIFFVIIQPAFLIYRRIDQKLQKKSIEKTHVFGVGFNFYVLFTAHSSPHYRSLSGFQVCSNATPVRQTLLILLIAE